MKKYLLMLGVAVLGLVSCSQMNDTHIKYRNEDIYSGKVSNVRGYPGIGTASIAWDNPSDYKSKKIFIEYYCFEDSIETWFSDTAFNAETSKLDLDSVVIGGLKYDMAYTFKVYTLDNDNNKSIADSVVVQNKTIESLKTLIGPSVDGSVDSSTGVDSVKLRINKLTDKNQYMWSGDLAFEVIQKDQVVYSEDNEGMNTKNTSYTFCPGKLVFDENNQAAVKVAVHIGMYPVVKNGLSSNNVVMADKFTWSYTFSYLLTK